MSKAGKPIPLCPHSPKVFPVLLASRAFEVLDSCPSGPSVYPLPPWVGCFLPPSPSAPAWPEQVTGSPGPWEGEARPLQGRSLAGYLGHLGRLWGEGSQGLEGRGRLKVSQPAGRRHLAEGTSGSWGSQAQGAWRWPPPLRPSGWWTGRLRLQSLHQRRRGDGAAPLSPAPFSQDEVPLPAPHPGLGSRTQAAVTEQRPCGGTGPFRKLPW